MRRISKSSRDIDVPSSSLADIAFLLIIFFMVTTLFNTAKGLRFDLPDKESKPKIMSRNELIIVDLEKSGDIKINGLLIKKQNINQRFIAFKKKVHKKNLLFRVNRDCEYGQFAIMASRLREAGFTRFSIKGVD